MYYEFLWNHVIEQGVFNMLKVTYCIASSINNSENSWSIYFRDLQLLEKMQKLICKLPKHFTNCKLQMATLSLV